VDRPLRLNGLKQRKGNKQPWYSQELLVFEGLLLDPARNIKDNWSL
jgi:hypothetical protein